MAEMSPSKTIHYKKEFEMTPLPKEMHATLSAEEIADKQVLVIGDVHGCLVELKELLTKANATPDNSIIIFCGDIINKGPLNVETLAYVRGLGPHAHCIRGNHEELVIIQWLKMQKANIDREQIKKKHRWISSLSKDDMDYLMELPYTISIPTLKTIIVHAGIDPKKPLLEQHPIYMTTMRNVVNPDEESSQIIEETDMGVAWGSVWAGPEHIYYGHDARRGFQEHKFATGLDTACVRGGSLTAAFLTGTKDVVSVKAKKEYKKKK